MDLKEYVEMNNITRQQIAEKTGLSLEQITRLYKGSGLLTNKKLVAKALGVSWRILFPEEEYFHPDVWNKEGEILSIIPERPDRRGDGDVFTEEGVDWKKYAKALELHIDRLTVIITDMLFIKKSEE